ncbi:MAG: GPW/gp25 family protein [Bacteroidota bacterium]
MHIEYPYRADGRGRTATADDAAYVRGLIEQVLFTAPGERVNRPEFGSGLRQLVFAANSEVLAGAVETSVQASLQRWLGDLVLVEAIDVTQRDATLSVRVRYVVRKTQQRTIAEFTRDV